MVACFREPAIMEPQTLKEMSEYANTSAYVVGVVVYGLVAFAGWSIL